LACYNAITESVRIVNLTPNSTWGGRGLLGCDIRFGALEQLPLRVKDKERLEKQRTGLGSILDGLSDK
jgi:hypothetical protein